MERTRRSAYNLMMECVENGEVVACIAVTDPEDGEQSVFVSAIELPIELEREIDGMAAAVLAIRHAHVIAHQMGMDPVY